MSKGKSCNLYVKAKKSTDEGDRVINLFFKKWKESKFSEELKARQYYEKPSVKKHRKKTKFKFLNNIYEKILIGQLKPKNKKLHKQILEKQGNERINIKKRNKK